MDTWRTNIWCWWALLSAADRSGIIGLSCLIVFLLLLFCLLAAGPVIAKMAFFWFASIGAAVVAMCLAWGILVWVRERMR